MPTRRSAPSGRPGAEAALLRRTQRAASEAVPARCLAAGIAVGRAPRWVARVHAAPLALTASTGVGGVRAAGCLSKALLLEPVQRLLVKHDASGPLAHGSLPGRAATALSRWRRRAWCLKHSSAGGRGRGDKARAQQGGRHAGRANGSYGRRLQGVPSAPWPCAVSSANVRRWHSTRQTRAGRARTPLRHGIG